MIELNSLIKTYGVNEASVQALNGISINIKKGEMIAITGPSGSGNSTLLNILGLIDKQTDGQYILNSINTKDLTEKEIAKCRNTTFGFIVQDFALIEEYTVLQNVELPLIYSNKKLNKNERKLMVKRVLESVGLSEKIHSYSYALSGGQRQRVAIARAIVNNPDIILADEPTGALDSKTSIEIMNIFCNLNKEGKTIILITHDKNIASYCSRIIEIKDGSII